MDGRNRPVFGTVRNGLWLVRSDMVVFRPSNGTWYMRNSQEGFRIFQFGIPTD